MSDLRLRPWWLTIGWVMVATVLFLCLMPAPPQPPVVTSDKAHHLIAFAGLGLWWRWTSRTAWAPHVALVGFAILIEVLQGTCTAHRQAEAMDVVADSLGLLCAEGLYRTPLGLLLRRLDQYLSSWKS